MTGDAWAADARGAVPVDDAAGDGDVLPVAPARLGAAGPGVDRAGALAAGRDEVAAPGTPDEDEGEVDLFSTGAGRGAAQPTRSVTSPSATSPTAVGQRFVGTRPVLRAFKTKILGVMGCSGDTGLRGVLTTM